MPSTLQYPIPGHSDGVILNKQTVRILTRDAASEYQAGVNLRFKIQDQKALDLQSVIMNYQIATTDPRASIDDWAGSIFRTISWSFNSHQIERIDHYNRVHNALASFTVDNGYRSSLWGDMEGYYSKAQGSFGNLGMDVVALDEYVIDADRNTIQVIVTNDGNTPITYTIVMPVGTYGTYTAAALVTAVDIQLKLTTGIDSTGAATAALTNSSITQAGSAFSITMHATDVPGTTVNAYINVGVANDLASQLGFTNTIVINATPVLTSAARTQEPIPLYETISDNAFPVVSSGKQYGGFLNSAWKIKKYSSAKGGHNHSEDRQYSVHFDLSGLFGRYRKLFWLPLVNSIDIEILLSQPAQVMNQWNVNVQANGAVTAQNPTGGPPTYVVKNAEIQAEMYTLSQEYVNALSQSMQEAGLTLSFDTYETHYNSLTTGGTHNVVLNTRLSSLKSIYIFFYQPNKTSAKEGKRLEKTWIQQRRMYNVDEDAVVKLSQYQIFIDGRPVQAHRISTTDTRHSEALFELQKSFRLHGDVTATPVVSRDEYFDRGLSPSVGNGVDAGPNDVQKMFAEEHFVVGVDLEKSDLLSGHSVANQLWVELQWSGAIGDGVDMYTVLHYDKNVVVYPGLVFEERV